MHLALSWCEHERAAHGWASDKDEKSKRKSTVIGYISRRESGVERWVGLRQAASHGHVS